MILVAVYGRLQIQGIISNDFLANLFPKENERKEGERDEQRDDKAVTA
jgi:hypothetical protein